MTTWDPTRYGQFSDERARPFFDLMARVAAQEPEKTQWKQSTARMNELFDAWQAHQKSGNRLSRKDEESLWKRFRGARTTFDRHRRAFFSKLDERNAEAKKTKQKLIAEADKGHAKRAESRAEMKGRMQSEDQARGDMAQLEPPDPDPQFFQERNEVDGARV